MTNRLQPDNLTGTGTPVSKTIRLLLIVAASVGFGYSLQTPVELIQPGVGYLPTPTVVTQCDVVHIHEQAPSFYWDTLPATSGANHYTVTYMLDNGATQETGFYNRGDWATVPTPPNGYITLTYYDTDRMAPSPLAAVGVALPPNPTCH